MVKAYIKNNMASQLSLQSTARQFTISQTYLSKMFRKYEDKSFNNYLTAIRMEEAKRLMKNEPDLFIKDIASMVGYNDQFYFSRIFRSYTGVCPSDFLAGSEG
jgi:YesN/AraC family two-component response regulator